MPTFQFNKLVRDKIVRFCLDDPLVTETNYRVLNGLDYKKALKDKVFEEGEEIPIREERDDEIVAEIADLQTVLDYLRDSYGISKAEVEAVQEVKEAKKGGFKEQYFIDNVTCDEASSWTKDFRERPEKYPELDTVHHDKLSKPPVLKLGKYRHYKGGEYEVIGLACDEATHEWMVLYKPLYDHDGPDVWVRSYVVFTEDVVIDGKKMKRFELL